MADDLIQSGDNFFREGKYLKAAALYVKAAKKAPMNAELQCNLSFAFLMEQRFQKALDAADTAISLDDSMEKAHFRRALALVALERWEDAVGSLIETQKRQQVTNTEVSDMLAMAKYKAKCVHLEAGTDVPELLKDAKRPEKAKTEGEVEGKEAGLSRKQLMQKLAEKQAVHKESRTRKHIKEANQKKAASATADKELITKAMLQQAKQTLEADQLARERAKDLTTDKVFDEKREAMKDGKALEYDAERVARFAQVELKGVTDAGDRSAFKEPVAIVLPGVFRDGWGDEGQGVSMWNAFCSSTRHSHASEFLAKYVQDTGAHAVIMVAHTTKVEYPVMNASKEDGFWVQLLTRDGSKNGAWFVEVRGTDEGVVHVLSECELIPDVFHFKKSGSSAGIRDKPTKKSKSKATEKSAKEVKHAMAVRNK